MALVTFTDGKGVRWHAWTIDSTSFSVPVNYLSEEFRGGWLCFETEDGRLRRRLVKFPEDWETLPTERLELLCKCAEPVAPRPRSSPRLLNQRVDEFLKEEGKELE